MSPTVYSAYSGTVVNELLSVHKVSVRRCNDHNVLEEQFCLVIPLWPALMDIYWTAHYAYEVEQYKYLFMTSTQLEHHFVNINVGMY